jgi:hypothetical protein
VPNFKLSFLELLIGRPPFNVHDFNNSDMQADIKFLKGKRPKEIHAFVSAFCF